MEVSIAMYQLTFNIGSEDRSNPISFESKADSWLDKKPGTLPPRRCQHFEEPRQGSISLNCHHIIPYTLYVNFWNALVRNGHIEHTGKFLDQFSRCLSSYSVKHTKGLKMVAELTSDIAQGKVKHDEDSTIHPEHFDFLEELFTYMPGNLFIGPGKGGYPCGCYKRSDDPDQAFET